MAAWAVEQCYFDSGVVRAKVRKAKEGEKSGFEERTRCDFYVDIFGSKAEAVEFANECKSA